MGKKAINHLFLWCLSNLCYHLQSRKQVTCLKVLLSFWYHFRHNLISAFIKFQTYLWTCEFQWETPKTDGDSRQEVVFSRVCLVTVLSKTWQRCDRNPSNDCQHQTPLAQNWGCHESMRRGLHISVSIQECTGNSVVLDLILWWYSSKSWREGEESTFSNTAFLRLLYKGFRSVAL